MTGRVVIVTGADRGVGYETARYLAAEGGYDVVLACRDTEKGQSAVQRIKKDNPSALVTFMQVPCVINKNLLIETVSVLSHGVSHDIVRC